MHVSQRNVEEIGLSSLPAKTCNNLNQQAVCSANANLQQDVPVEVKNTPEQQEDREECSVSHCNGTRQCCDLHSTLNFSTSK